MGGIDEQPYPFSDQQDQYTKAATIMDAEHALIHKGQHFFAGDYSTGVSTRDFLIIAPPVKYCHLLLAIATNGAAQVNIYEDTVVSANGTSIPVFNNNRKSAIAPTTTLFFTPTVTGVGTLLTSSLIGSSINNGGQSRSNNEIVLVPGKKYLVRITGTTLTVAFNPSFYELG